MIKSGPGLQLSEIQMVDFKLGEQEYAIEIRYINEIISYKEPRPIPKAPDFIEGVVDLRGSVIPVIDLTKKLGIPKGEFQNPNHILVVKLHQTVIGISVEKVLEVTEINFENIQEAQGILKRGEIRYLKGFCKISGRLVLFIDIAGILSEAEKDMLHEVL